MAAINLSGQRITDISVFETRGLRNTITGNNVTLANLTIAWSIHFDTMTNLRCESCTFTAPVFLHAITDTVITGCTFGDTLTLDSISALTLTNSAVQGTTYLVTTGTGIDLSAPSNTFASVIDIQPAPGDFISYGVTGVPDVLLPAALDYAYVSDPTIAPSEAHSICSSQRITSGLDLSKLWYGFQFSTGYYIIEHGFDPVSLLNNVQMTTPTISNMVEPNTILFALEADLPTDAVFTTLRWNDVLMKSDDKQRTYVYNGNVYAATRGGTNLWIMPHTVTAITPASIVAVSTVGGSGWQSSDEYKSAATEPLPPIRADHTWFTPTAEGQRALLTGPELEAALGPQASLHARNGVACLATGAAVMTPTGYRSVETLRYGDLIQTSDGRAVPIKVYRTDLAEATVANAPCSSCIAPLTHYQIRRGTWMSNTGAARREGAVGNPITYYHIECPNVFRDHLLVNGITVESYVGTQLAAIPASSQRYHALFMD